MPAGRPRLDITDDERKERQRLAKLAHYYRTMANEETRAKRRQYNVEYYKKTRVPLNTQISCK